MINYYQILGISNNSSFEEIKKAYRKLAIKYHPDKTSNNKQLEDKFKEVNKAYQTLSNYTLKIQYDKDLTNNSSFKPGEWSSKEITTSSIFEEAVLIWLLTSKGNKNAIQRKYLFNKLSSLLSEDNKQVLLISSESEKVNLIVDYILKSSRILSIESAEEIYLKLLTLNKYDNIILKKINLFKHNRNKYRHTEFFDFIYKFKLSEKALIFLFSKILVGLILLGIYGLFALIIYLIPQNSTRATRPYSGNILKDSSTVIKSIVSLDSLNIIKEKVKYENWDKVEHHTGDVPSCFYFKNKSNRNLDNYLTIEEVGEDDSVIKLINKKNKKCIRYLYIRSGEKVTIKNIPEGIYYLKMAFGKDWRQKFENGNCSGRFTVNPSYKKGDLLNYFITNKRIKIINDKRYQAYSIPSYSINLETKFLGDTTRYKSDIISGDDFNNY